MNTGLMTLIIFMGIDYLTALIVAGVFHKSKKTENGALESSIGWKGICRKCMTLMIVIIAARFDIVMHTDFIKDAVIIAYTVNETISILENMGLMGLPVPEVLIKAIDVLKKKEGETDERK